MASSDTRQNPSELRTKIPVGISSCLLGNAVRHNAGHTLSTYCRDELSSWFDYRPVCPEMAIGLGTPRPTIKLVQVDGQDRAIQNTDPVRDITASLTDTAHSFLQLHPDLCGFIFMERSPSCGVWRVKHYNQQGNPLPAEARGIFARTLLQQQPLLPVEEAGRLQDPELRENFILRVFVAHDWQQQVRRSSRAADLIAFWTRYKYLVLAHDESAYRDIGRLVAQAGSVNLASLCELVYTRLMQALAEPSSVQGNLNALEHLRGFVKQHADRSEKASLTRSLDQYRRGHVPLIVPLTLLRHLLERYPASYASEQQYLQPYPDELCLRNYK